MSQHDGMSNGVAAPTSASKASEIGWLFVPQYYTLLNNDPSRVHCFYTKNSSMVHAAENEETQVSYGQQVSSAVCEAL